MVKKDSKANRTLYEKENPGKKAMYKGKQTKAYKAWRGAGEAKKKSGGSKADTQGGKRRDFGGAGKKDWFKLHSSSEGGMTVTKAKALAKKLRAAGDAVVLDPLGGGGKLGVYHRPSKRKAK